jgi:methylphosphotriester-DNA--protein-cysteine methyltransferase
VGCHALARSRPDRRVTFASIEDARSVGYRPCRLCRPDTA